jgi:hypothetical protein
MSSCRCCSRPFTEWDGGEVLADPDTGDIVAIGAPDDGLCIACAPEDQGGQGKVTHRLAHEQWEGQQ